jgi:RNA-binding protein YhbY
MSLTEKMKHDLITRICHQFDAELVQAIGHIALIYRKHPD